MPCCNKKPRIRLIHHSVLHPVVTWNDHGCTGSQAQTYQWRFFKNGHLVYATGFAAGATSLAIGTGSTYASLNATAAQITSFLISEGVTIQNGDYLDVEVRVRNCQDEIGASNRIRIIVIVNSNGDCDCAFLTGPATGQIGNTATLPGGLTDTAGLLAFRNGLLNYEGLDFTGEPLLSDDLLLFATLTGCDGTLSQAEVTGETGTVTVPGAFTSLDPADYLLFRNGAALRSFSVSGGELTVTGEPVSESTDRWLFVLLAGSSEGCTFGRILIQVNASGNTVTLPVGYTASNQNKWLLVRGPLLQYPTTGYTVSGSTITLTTPADGEAFWLIVID